MKLFSSLPSRSYVIVSTVVLLLGLFAYYFWVYLPQREDLLIAKRVRDLKQLAQNFQEKDDIYHQTANTIFGDDKIKDYLIHKDSNNNKVDIKNLNLELANGKVNPNLFFIEDDSTHKEYLAYHYHGEDSQLNQVNKKIKLVIPIQDFLESIKREESFDQYVLFKNNGLAYNTLNGEVLKVFSESSISIKLADLGNSITEESVSNFTIGELSQNKDLFEQGHEVNVSAVAYKLFSTNLRSENDNNGSNWTIIALSNAEQFEAEMKEVPELLVIHMSIFILILIFGLPLIKLSLISPIERLYRSDVVLATSAFVVCTGLLVLFLFFVVSYHNDRQRIDDQLEILSQKIQNTVGEELQEVNALMSGLESEAYEYAKTHDNTGVYLHTDTFTDLPYPLIKQFHWTNISESKLRLPYPERISKIDRAYVFAENDRGYVITDKNRHIHAIRSKYPFLKGQYWMDHEGERRYLLTTISSEEGTLPAKNFKDRAYFKKLIDGDGWRGDGELIDTTFYIQSITSWLNLEKLLVVSRPSSVKNIGDKKVSVTAASFRFHSLMDAILPPAYSFCVTDEAGKVLFHSNSKKNLQENFLEEIEGHKVVKSSFDGKNSGYADVNYGGSDHRIYFKGFDKLPWVLVTFYEKNFIEAPYLQIISQSVIYILIIGGLAFVQLYLLSIWDRLPTKLKKKVYYYDWLWPRKLNKGVYLQVMFFNLLMLVLLIVYNIAWQLTILDTLASFLYAMFFSNTTAWLLLSDDEKVKKRGILIFGLTAITCLFILLFTLFYTQHTWNNVLLLLIIASLSAYLVRYKLAPLLRKAYWYSVLKYLGVNKTYRASLFQKLIFTEAIVQHKKIAKAKRATIKHLSNNLSFRRSYRLMMFTFLFISSILPACFLFNAAYFHEQLVWKKYSMYELSKATDAKLEQLKKELYYKGKDDPRFNHAKAVANYHQYLDYSSCKCPSGKVDSIPKMRWDELMHRSRPFFTNMFVATNGFVLPGVKNHWESSLCACGVRMKRYNIHSSSEKNIVLASSLRGLNWNYTLDKFDGEILWVGLIILLFGLYYALRFASNKFFSLDLFNNLNVTQVDDHLLENYFEESNDDKVRGDKHLFIVALPYTGIKSLYENSHNFKIFDVPHLLKTKDEALEVEEIMQLKNSNVVLEHFSYVIEDTKANSKILKIIEQLLWEKNNIIIISRLSPTQIIDYYESRIRYAENKEEMKVNLSKWKDILAGFIKSFYHSPFNKKLDKNVIAALDIKALLAYEFRVSDDYFKRIKGAFTLRWDTLVKYNDPPEYHVRSVDQKMQQKIVSLCTQPWEPKGIKLNPILAVAEAEKKLHPLNYKDVKEEVILKIQSMAQPFYFSLWNTCSKEEKYLLYDLAMDGFVNTQNERGLKKLIEKGLVYYNGSLEIMNESFSNFILSTIKESESLTMEKELRQHGSWSLYSSIFFILLIGLLTFVAISQQEIVSKFIALMAGLATAIPYLLKFSGLFSSLSPRSKSVASGSD